jgi:hypothetical protein
MSASEDDLQLPGPASGACCPVSRDLPLAYLLATCQDIRNEFWIVTNMEMRLRYMLGWGKVVETSLDSSSVHY